MGNERWELLIIHLYFRNRNILKVIWNWIYIRKRKKKPLEVCPPIQNTITSIREFSDGWFTSDNVNENMRMEKLKRTRKRNTTLMAQSKGIFTEYTPFLKFFLTHCLCIMLKYIYIYFIYLCTPRKIQTKQPAQEEGNGKWNPKFRQPTIKKGPNEFQWVRII